MAEVRGKTGEKRSILNRYFLKFASRICHFCSIDWGNGSFCPRVWRVSCHNCWFYRSKNCLNVAGDPSLQGRCASARSAAVAERRRKLIRKINVSSLVKGVNAARPLLFSQMCQFSIRGADNRHLCCEACPCLCIARN